MRNTRTHRLMFFPLSLISKFTLISKLPEISTVERNFAVTCVCKTQMTKYIPLNTNAPLIVRSNVHYWTHHPSGYGLGYIFNSSENLKRRDDDLYIIPPLLQIRHCESTYVVCVRTEIILYNIIIARLTLHVECHIKMFVKLSPVHYNRTLKLVSIFCQGNFGFC